MTRRPRGGSLRRRVTRAEVRRELLVFTEGKVTEPGYVVHWHRRHRRTVTIRIDPFQGGPLQLVERAVRARKEGGRDERNARGRAFDEIWCMFDVDEHPKLAEAVALARDHGIRLARSNPCIELWFMLHFQDQTASISPKDAQRRSKQLLGCEKALTPEALAALDAGVADATRRARALEGRHRHDGSPPGHNPSSSVWTFVAALEQNEMPR